MRKILLIILALVLLCVAPAFAGTCTVRGTVTDADGSLVKGAQVTLFDANRAEVMTVDTDAGGRFVFTNARVDTDTCTVRVFYNDLRQTYNNAAYFSEWYTAKGNQAVPIKDTRLGTLHQSSSSSNAARQPLGSISLSTAVAAIAYILVASGCISWNKRR